VLVVRLIDRLSQTELQERREALEAGMLGFRAALAGNLFRAMSESHPGPPGLFYDERLHEELADQFMRNSRRTGETRLVSGLALGTRTENGEIRYEQFDPGKGKFIGAAWPQEIAGLRAALQPAKAEDKPNTDRRLGFSFLLAGERPMIALPLMSPEPGSGSWAGPEGPVLRRGPNGAGGDRITQWEARERGAAGRAGLNRKFDPGSPGPRERGWRILPEFAGSPPPPRPAEGSPPDGFGFPPRGGLQGAGVRVVGWCFLVLDFHELKTVLIPQLLERHFRGREREFGLALISPTESRVILQAGPSVQFGPDCRLDAVVNLIERRPFPGDPRGSRPLSDAAHGLTLSQVYGGQWNGWVLAARHETGSLESVVGRGRSRSTAIALGFLALLGGSGIVLVWTSRKSRELARRQMEFVAGVSHELLTPLSVIRTAASNLSRGLISDKEKALEYGKTLERESKRLSKMIEQVLGFAALQAGTNGRRSEPVDVSPLLREILSDYRCSLEPRGWEVCEQIEAVGKAHIDRRVLESCLYNLIDNATKYAECGRWLRVTASRDQGKIKPRVRITVEDHGPGIADEDLRHIFKPFYRGRGLAASNVPGAGLGLSIVRQRLRSLGGDISVTSTAQGCAFSVVVPGAE